MTNRSAVFDVNAIVEHWYYCSIYILPPAMPRHEVFTLAVVPTYEKLKCIRLTFIVSRLSINIIFAQVLSIPL